MYFLSPICCHLSILRTKSGLIDYTPGRKKSRYDVKKTKHHSTRTMWREIYNSKGCEEGYLDLPLYFIILMGKSFTLVETKAGMFFILFGFWGRDCSKVCLNQPDTFKCFRQWGNLKSLTDLNKLNCFRERSQSSTAGLKKGEEGSCMWELWTFQ